MPGYAEVGLVDLSDQIEEFLCEKSDGTATVREICRYLFLVWSPTDIWTMARENPHRFAVVEEERQLLMELRTVRLLEQG